MIINKPCSELDNLVTEILQDLIFEQQNKPTSHSRAISDITALDFIVGQISCFLSCHSTYELLDSYMAF